MSAATKYANALRGHELYLSPTGNCGVYHWNGTRYLARNLDVLEHICRNSPAAVVLCFNTHDLADSVQKELFETLLHTPMVTYTKCHRINTNTLHVFVIPTREYP